MSRILFLSQLLPYPPDAGPKVRSYYVLRHLTQAHRVTLLAFSRPDDRPEAVAHLREFCADVQTVLLRRSRGRDLLALAASLFSGESFIIRRDRAPEMIAAVDRLLQNRRFDAVHTDQLWMSQYAVRARALAPGARTILDEHNACYQIFQRLAGGETNPLKRLLFEREWRALRAYEANTCRQFDEITTVTEEDRQILVGLMEGKTVRGGTATAATHSRRMTAIPICVDCQSVAPVTPRGGAVDVLHLGTMFWLPNIEGMLWFAREVWPKVIAMFPQATLTIIGKNPPASIQDLAAGPEGPGRVVVTGYVADPQPYLERAGVFIVPLRSGGGMRVKIVDAWRWGLPVVSTSIGAEGIRYRDGENLLIADDAEAFARAVVRVLCDPQLAGRLRGNGRRWAEQTYDWRAVYPAWDQIYPPEPVNA